MATQRIYVNAVIFGVPIVGIRNLWEPATTYKGQPAQKPSWLTSVLIRKTQAHWSQEPVMAGFVAACQDLYAKALQPVGVPFEQVVWPLKDGDLPSEPGRMPAEWMKGCWMLNASSTQPINVEIMQGGKSTKLPNRAMVKPGDLVALSGALAVKANDPRGVKMYANNVVFMSPGEEIAIGNGVTGAELMEQARAQGLNVTGFTPGGAGGFTMPHTTVLPPNTFAQPNPNVPGFGQAGFAAPAPVQPPSGGFAPPQGFGPPR